MKISIVHSFYSSAAPSGENVIVSSQVEALRNAGHEVQLISRKTHSQHPGIIGNLKLGIKVATGSGDDPSKEIEEFSPDVIHIHNLFPNFGTKWIPKMNIPIVTTLHNFRTICSAGTLLRDGKYCDDCLVSNSLQAVSNACYRESKIATVPLAISTYSPLLRNTLLNYSSKIVVLSSVQFEIFNKLGVNQGKLVTIPNFTKPVDIQSEFKSGWVYVGRLSSEKGVDKLISNWPTTELLTVYGEGPLVDVVKKSENIGVRYGGLLEHGDVKRVLSESIGLIFPSECFEAGPVVYLEAIAAGLPVVAKFGNAASDDITNFGTGVVFKSWDQIQDALDEVNKKRNQFAERAIRRFKTNFSEEQYVGRIENVYNSVINPNTPD